MGGTGRMIFGLICMLQCLIKTNGAFFCFFFFYSRLFVYLLFISKKGFSLFYVDFQFCLVKKHPQLMPNLTYVHTNSCLLIKKKVPERMLRQEKHLKIGSHILS